MYYYGEVNYTCINKVETLVTVAHSVVLHDVDAVALDDFPGFF
jgi:hypothetical protein